MFSNFPKRGKIISVIMLIGIVYLLYENPPWNNPDKGFNPKIKEYQYLLVDDTIGLADTINPYLLIHYWYKDSNSVWHEDKGATDSSEYKKKHLRK